MKKSIVILIMFFLSSCISRDTDEIDRKLLSDLSGRALELQFLNISQLQGILKNQVSQSGNVATYNLILDAAYLIDSLADDYVIKSGGMKDGKFFDPLKAGALGYDIYMRHDLKARLRTIVDQVNKLNIDTNNEAVKAFNYVIDRNFLASNAYFSESILKTKPSSVLTLDLMVIENSLYVMIIKDLHGKK
jgi:hypothetical protein